jgi:hypothetical protein
MGIRVWLASALWFTACSSAGSGGDDDDDVSYDAGPDAAPDAHPPIDWPDAPGDYVPTSLSYMSTIAIPSFDGNGDPVCCHDFGNISKDSIEQGTDKIDNALSRVAELLLSVGTNLQDEIDAALESGTLLNLLDHRDLASGDGPFILVQFLASFAPGTTYVQASAGAGSFVIDPISFVNGTGEPTNYFVNAAMTGGAMTAGPSTLHLSLPFGSATLEMQLIDARVTGRATLGAGGVSYGDGTVAGVVRLDELFGAFNAYLEQACGCLALTDPVYYQDDFGDWQAACVPDAEVRCTLPGESPCVNLGDSQEVCSFLPIVLRNSADINLDVDSTRYEALSAGFHWTGVQAAAN